MLWNWCTCQQKSSYHHFECTRIAISSLRFVIYRLVGCYRPSVVVVNVSHFRLFQTCCMDLDLTWQKSNTQCPPQYVGPINEQIYLHVPHELIGWNIFDFSATLAERNLKIGRTYWQRPLWRLCYSGRFVNKNGGNRKSLGHIRTAEIWHSFIGSNKSMYSIKFVFLAYRLIKKVAQASELLIQYFSSAITEWNLTKLDRNELLNAYHLSCLYTNGH